jgi:ribosome biogenesis GTPase A
MTHPVIDDRFALLKNRIEDHLKQIQEMLTGLESSTLHGLVSDMRSGLNEPFLFVVVGEVKSGKSSFINALLGESICAVDPAPCTDVIQEIVFARQRYEETLRPLLKKIGLPLPVLQSIAIVDTPGTNTVIENHQEITQTFIPSSDLVLMVFPAKNPYTKSAWDLLDFIHEDWRKRIIFILQQADLARPDEIETNTARVRELALQKGITDPRIFATSATRALEGAPESGIEAVRHFIRETVTGGRHYRLKLESILNAADQILQKVDLALAERRHQLEQDQKAVANVRQRLARGHQQAVYELQQLVERLGDIYTKEAERLVDEFQEGISVGRLFQRALRSTLGRRDSVKRWFASLQGRFEESLQARTKEASEDRAAHFVEGLEQLLQQLLREIETVREAGLPASDLFQRLERRRREVIAAVQSNLGDAARTTTLDAGALANPDSLAPSLVGGSALTAIGAFVLAVTHGLFFDITGGILTGTGLLLAGGVLFVRKGRMVTQLQAQLEKGRTQFQEALTDKLAARLQMIFDDIDRSFAGFYHHVAQEEARLQPASDQLAQRRQGQTTLLDEIRKALPL